MIINLGSFLLEYLLQLTEDETIRRILGTALETPVVQGVVLDLDPFWLQCWRLHSQLGSAGDRYLDRWFEYWYYVRHRYGGIPPLGSSNVKMEGTLPESPYFVPSQPLRKQDLKWFPSFWKYYAQEMGVPETGLPIVVKICLRPAAENEELRTPEFSETRFRVVYETRPVATLYGSPREFTRPLIGGLSIGLGPKVSGTLGGILQDSQGNRYGMTCSHVTHDSSGAYRSVEQPAASDSGSFFRLRKGSLRSSGAGSTKVGSFVVSSPLCSAKQEAVCNPYSGLPMNEVDAALIKIDKAVSSEFEVMDIGPLTGVTPRARLTPGQTVEIAGKSSGIRRLVIGGLAVTYRFRSYNGEYYCFKNLFELRWPSYWRLMGGSPVESGDSGAWVCNANSSSFGWCGMVVGGDRLLGYAQFSETVQAWWNTQKLSLSVQTNGSRGMNNTPARSRPVVKRL